MFTADELTRLRILMNWVVPPDSCDGAGTDTTLAHLLDLLESLPPTVLATYRQFLPDLSEADLGDPNHALGPMLVEHVRDVYYGHPDTGAWADIGFALSGP